MVFLVGCARQSFLIEVPMALAALTRETGADYGKVVTRRRKVELIIEDDRSHPVFTGLFFISNDRVLSPTSAAY